MEKPPKEYNRYRWVLVTAAFVVMMVISIYQYSWFLFAYAIQEEFYWSLTTVSLTFTFFAYSATFVQPFSGFLADYYGPQKIAIIAASLVGLGFVLSSFALSPGLLYAFYGLGSLGVGILYGISTATAVKWFPDKRGFATGIVVFGFGAGTAVFNWFIQNALIIHGISATFRMIGILMIAVLVPLSLLYRYPSEAISSPSKSIQTDKTTAFDWKPTQMLTTYQWFLIYISFTATVSVVLMFGAQMKSLAKEFDIPTNYFTAVLFLFPLGNGLSRIVAGAVSDKIGRAKTMVIFYLGLGLSILIFVAFAHIHAFFVVIVFIAALLGGSPFALYPATIGDYYGPRYSTVNYGITYTAKAWAGLISGWLSAYLVQEYGSFKIPLIFVAVLSLIAAAISNPKFMKSPKWQSDFEKSS